MVVMPGGSFYGTIGGGRLEWEALQVAGDMLAAGRGPARFVDHALGPDLGQCCGGHVTLLVETFAARDAAEVAKLAEAESQGGFEVEARIRSGRVVRAELSEQSGEGVWRERHGEDRTALLLFGAGHVGRALVLALAPLPFAIRWIDSRADAFPPYMPANAIPVRAKDPVAEIGAAGSGAFVLVMTHEHSLDLAITAVALARQDLPFVGLIGSGTKRARFERRLRDLGVPPHRISALTCPIGVRGIEGKEPAVIAASVAAQLCLERERLAGGSATFCGATERFPEETG
jgi:xanthine dehydrogenase accessory factor